MTGDRPIESLWRDYLFLSQETAKFAAVGDMDMVGELMDQRGRLQTIIDSRGERQFPLTAAGRTIIRQIREKNDLIGQHIRLHINKEKRRQNFNRAYEGPAVGPDVGRRMDRQG